MQNRTRHPSNQREWQCQHKNQRELEPKFQTRFPWLMGLTFACDTVVGHVVSPLKIRA